MEKQYRITVGMAMHPQAVRLLESAAEVRCMPWDDPALESAMLESDALITYTPRFDEATLARARICG